jgi:hypothetical protein
VAIAVATPKHVAQYECSLRELEYLFSIGRMTFREANALVASLCLLFVAGLHVYWAFGGEFGIAVSVPERDGRPLFKPGKPSTLLVALVIFEAACTLTGLAIPTWQLLSAKAHDTLAWIFGAAFLVRGVGGLLFFSISPQLRRSRFARMDRILYSPLCLYLALTFLTFHMQ